MKKIKNLLMALIAMSMLSSCEAVNNSSTSESDSSSVEENTSTPDSSSEEESSSEELNEYNKLPNWEEESFDISYGGDFLDVIVGRSFMTGAEYSLSFTLGNKVNSTIEKLEVSNENVLEAELIGTTIKVKALHEGQVKLRLTDSLGIIRYCGIITVKDAIPLADMEEYLVYECEYWVTEFAGTGYNYVITFNEGGVFTINATMSNTTYAPITGTYSYVETVNNGKEYVYEFTPSQDLNVLDLVGFQIASTGTFMYLQYSGGTDAILFPNHVHSVE